MSDELRDLEFAAEAIRLEGTISPVADPDHIQDLGGVTYRELVENRFLLDRAGHAISTACDCDYLGALEKLDRWATLARKGEESPTLREIFPRASTYLIQEATREARKQRRREGVSLQDEFEPGRHWRE